MNKKRFLHLILIGSIISNFLLGFYVISSSFSSSFDPDKPKQVIIRALDLDSEQQRTYERLIIQHRKDIRKLDETIMNFKKDLYQNLIQSDSVRADSISFAIGIIQTKIEKVHYHHFEDIKKLCKPYQLPKFDSLTKNLNKIFSHSKQTNSPKR